MVARRSEMSGEEICRRRVPRVSTDAWPARYIDQDNPGLGVRECRVIDLSLLGVGLEVLGVIAEDVVGHRVEIYVNPREGCVSLRLVGRVKNVSQGRLGGTRVGVEFEGLSETEQDILKVLELPRMVW